MVLLSVFGVMGLKFLEVSLEIFLYFIMVETSGNSILPRLYIFWLIQLILTTPAFISVPIGRL